MALPEVIPVVDNAVVNTLRAAGRSRRRWLGLGLGTALLGAALATELRKPAGERTWHGRMAGRGPYDLRLPTLARGHEGLWNRAGNRDFVPTPLGRGLTPH